MTLIELIAFIEKELSTQHTVGQSFIKREDYKGNEKFERYCDILKEVRDALIDQKADPKEVIGNAIKAIPTPAKSTTLFKSDPYENQLKVILTALNEHLKNTTIFNYPTNDKGILCEPATVIKEWHDPLIQESRVKGKDFDRGIMLGQTKITDAKDFDEAADKLLENSKFKGKNRKLVKEWILTRGGQDLNRLPDSIREAHAEAAKESKQEYYSAGSQGVFTQQGWIVDLDRSLCFKYKALQHLMLDNAGKFYACVNNQMQEITPDRAADLNQRISKALNTGNPDSIADIPPLLEMEVTVALVVKNGAVDLEVHHLTIISHDPKLNAMVALPAAQQTLEPGKK